MPAQVSPTPDPAASRVVWVNIGLAAVLMLATLPGRTQGLGLITEPLLQDLRLDRVAYAGINLWATLLGAAFCLPAGRLIDRFGMRWVSGVIVLLLGAAVWEMSECSGDPRWLFLWVFLTRALGQSALSVASITLAGKSTGGKVALATGVYSILLTMLFIAAFYGVGQAVSKATSPHGWRLVWSQVALALLLGVAPLVLLFLREPKTAVLAETKGAAPSLPALSLGRALRTPAFWVFAGATALFGLVSSGLGLFNEAVLAERGFDADAYHLFLEILTGFMLLGQFFCGWLGLRWTMPRLLGAAMFMYAVGMGILIVLHTMVGLWILAGIIGMAAGFITVIFFAVWGQAFGKAYLGKIQGAAQMLTVFASAVGPLLFAVCHERTGSYAALLYGLAPVVLVMGGMAWRVEMPPISDPHPETS